MMELSPELIQELEYLFNHTVDQGKISEIAYLEVGADTFIHKITFSGSDTATFILRSFREKISSGRPKREFRVMEKLYNDGIPIPKVYFTNPDETKANYPYLLMEFIPGGSLWEQMNDKDPNQQIMRAFIKELVEIHQFDWSTAFPEAESPDIQTDPFAFIKQYIQSAKVIATKFDIVELLSLTTWLEDHKEMGISEDLVMLHGDYHPGNVIVCDGKLYIIDWSNVKIGDFRLDLGFCIGIVEAFSGLEMRQNLIELYSMMTKKEITNLEYFIILAHLYNILRFYGILIDPKITNEDPTKIDQIKQTFSQYARYMVAEVERITGVSLELLRAELHTTV